MRFVKKVLFMILAVLVVLPAYANKQAEDATGLFERARSCVLFLVERGVDFMREQTRSDEMRFSRQVHRQEASARADYKENFDLELETKIPRRLIRNLFNRLSLDPFSYIGSHIVMLLGSDLENTLQSLINIYENSNLSIEQQYFLINIIASSHARIPYFVFETVNDWNSLSLIEMSFRWYILKQAYHIRESHPNTYSSYNESLSFILSKFIFTERGWIPFNTLFVGQEHELAGFPQWRLSANIVFINREQNQRHFHFLSRGSSETENQQADKVLIQDLLLLPPGRRGGSHEYFYLMIPQGLLLKGFLRNPQNRIKAQMLVEHTPTEQQRQGVSELRSRLRDAFLLGAMHSPLAEKIIDHILYGLGQGITEAEAKEYLEFLRATHTLLRDDPHLNYEDAVKNILDHQEWESPAFNLPELTESSSDVASSTPQAVEGAKSRFWNSWRRLFSD